METEIPLEKLYEQPAVQQLLSQIEDLQKSNDLEKDVKLPYVIKNKILFSSGVWNGYFYSEDSIQNAYLQSEWGSKEVRSLFLDHKDLNSREWVGEIRNPRMVGTDLIGDLFVVDKATAMKLAYGAKMGISPKVTGREEEGAMQKFLFDNFSVVINPAVKTAYINNQEVSKMGKDIETEIPDTSKDEAKKPKKEVIKDKDSSPVEEKKMSEQKTDRPSDIELELSAHTVFVKSYMQKNPGSTILNAAEAYDKQKKSESILMSDVMEVITSLKTDMTEMKTKIMSLTQNNKEDKPAEEAPSTEKPKEKPDEKVPGALKGKPKNGKPEKGKPVVEDTIKNSEKTIQELSAKLQAAETKLNEPDRVSVKTQEMSEKGDMDEQILSHLQGLGPMEV